MISKNEEYIVDILDNGFQGEGIAKIDGQVVFIPNAIKDEKVKIKKIGGDGGNRTRVQKGGKSNIYMLSCLF